MFARTTPPERLARLLVMLALAGLLGLACARKGLPPGGPRDETPPYVTATQPDSGAVRVPLDADLEIEFSEDMDKNSVLDWVLLSPPRDFGQRGWSGKRFRLAGGDDFMPQTTYTIIVGTGCRDYREHNAMKAPYTFVFSTGDSIHQGRIEGRLDAKEQTAHGTMVWAFDLELHAARPDTMLPDYIAQAAADSTYVLLGLRTDRRYIVAAHFDANRDREFDAGSEFLAFHPDTLFLASDQPVRTAIDIDFRDPAAPGSIAGAVLDSTLAALETVGMFDGGAAAAISDTLAAGADSTDSRPAAVDADSLTRPLAPGGTRIDTLRSPVPDTLAAAAPADTVRIFLVTAWPWIAAEGVSRLDSAAAQAAATDTLGRYELRRLDPGFWRVQAWLDQDGNERYDAGEPTAAAVDSVEVQPLEQTAVDFVVRDSVAAPGSQEE